MNSAAARYWRWYGRLLASWAQQLGRRRRRRTVIILGGPVFWLLFLFVLILGAMLYVAIVFEVVVALTIVGLLVSFASGVASAVESTRHPT